MIPLQRAYLCPGGEDGPHITANARGCECGNANLVSLARILDRVALPPLEDLTIREIEDGWEGLLASLRSLQHWYPKL